jgi:hypothetical protein
MDTVTTFFNKLPALKKDKSPNVAGVIGFLFGGIGLAFYFWSFIDLLFPVTVVVCLAVLLKGGGWLIGALLAGTYGYFRAQTSNAARASAPTPSATAHPVEGNVS